MRTYELTAAQLGDDPDQSLAAVWLANISPANWSPGTQVGQTGLPLAGPENETVPIFVAHYADAGTNAAAGSNSTRLVYRAPAFYFEPGRFSTITSWPVHLPWRTGSGAWSESPSSDHIALVDDDESGANGYECQNLRPANLSDQLAYWFAGLTLPDGAYVADQLQRRTPATIGTYTGHGSGDNVPKVAGILTADMAANGVTQALSFVAFAVNYGPGAKSRRPGRVEHPNTAQRSSTGLPSGADPRMTPNGLRLRLDYTPSERTALAAAVPSARRTAFRNTLDGLCVYGWIQDETGGSRVGSNESCLIETTGTMNPREAAKWAALGMTTQSHFTHLLDGLFVTGRVKVVAQPSTTGQGLPTPVGVTPVRPRLPRASIAAHAGADDD